MLTQFQSYPIESINSSCHRLEASSRFLFLLILQLTTISQFEFIQNPGQAFDACATRLDIIILLLSLPHIILYSSVVRKKRNRNLLKEYKVVTVGPWTDGGAVYYSSKIVSGKRQRKGVSHYININDVTVTMKTKKHSKLLN